MPLRRSYDYACSGPWMGLRGSRSIRPGASTTSRRTRVRNAGQARQSRVRFLPPLERMPARARSQRPNSGNPLSRKRAARHPRSRPHWLTRCASASAAERDRRFVTSRRSPNPHFSPAFCCGRRSARCGGPYSLTPLRRSYDYVCSGFRRWGCAPNPRRLLAGTPSPRAAAAGPRRARLSFDPSRRLDALATNAGEKCGLTVSPLVPAARRSSRAPAALRAAAFLRTARTAPHRLGRP